jgi:predicted outer membrane repeat protein
MPSLPIARTLRTRPVPPRAACWLICLAAMPAYALDIPVDVLGDPAPNGCTPGDCSLREAVALANSLAGPDRILLPPTPGLPLQLSIVGANEDGNARGDLDVRDDLEIVGAGADATLLVQTVSDRVLHTTMPPEGRLVLRGLTIQGGSSDVGGGLNTSSLLLIEDAAFVDNEASGQGGAIAFTGPFAPSITQTRLVLRRVRFDANSATNLSDFASGGALHATSLSSAGSFLLVEDSQFDGNEAKNGGGAIYLSGSINWFGGDVTVRDSQFTGNRSGGNGGAAMYVSDSSFDLRIEGSLFDTNTTTSNGSLAGGAIYLLRARSADVIGTTLSSNSGPRGGAIQTVIPARLIDSHLFDNTAANSGGAVLAYGDLLVERSTFESNRVASTDADDDGGGAIHYSGNGGTLAVQRSTLSGNDALRGGAISMEFGLLQLYGSTIVAPSTGIAGRAATAVRFLEDNNSTPLAIANSILYGSCTFPSAGRRLAVAYNNIEGSGTTCRLAGAVSASDNRTGATPAQIALGRLGDNGGPTPTHLPEAGSIAIDAGRRSHCATNDQRHYPVTDRACDIGAVEVGAAPAPDAIFADGFDLPAG